MTQDPQAVAPVMSDDADDTLDLSTGLSRNDLRRAALVVCGYSTDVDDARSLLESLGLEQSLREESVSS